MKYKVTALQDVTIFAYVPFQEAVHRYGRILMKPSEGAEWITLRAGDVRENLGLVLGIHPASLPGHRAIRTPDGVELIFCGDVADETLPQDVAGVFRIEAQ